VGVIPKFVSEWFDKRKKYKKMMIERKKAGDKEGEQYYNLLQWNFKILINSVYGYLGTRYSRFYDVDNARAVTLTGQAGLKRTINRLNNFFQNEWAETELGKKLGATNFKDFVVYGDTDSVYASCGRLMNSFQFKPSKFTKDDLVRLKKAYEVETVEVDDKNIEFTVKGKTTKHQLEHEYVIDFLNVTMEPYIQDIIENNMVAFTVKSCNCKVNKISFKRESICRSAIFVEKKKYAAWLLNDEGNVPADKLKVTGLDIVRSNTPTIAKKALKEIVYDILRKIDREHTVKQIRETREKFLHSAPHDIAFNAPVNGLTKYKEKFKLNNDQFKSTPKHVRAAMIYNAVLAKRKDLQDKYDFIYNGDKIKYLALKPGADWEDNVLAFKGKWINELKLDTNIDREMQFRVGVLNLMEKLFKLMNWELPRFDCHSFASIFKKKS
jgi:DNA polymerase elongation subunit (family B)